MSRAITLVLFVAMSVGCDAKKGAAERATAGMAEQQEPKKDADGVPTERKIIHTARIDVHVKSLDEARTKLEALLAESKGYIAKSEESGRVGVVRSGTWKVRVPVAQYVDFLNRVQALGELLSKSSDA